MLLSAGESVRTSLAMPAEFRTAPALHSSTPPSILMNPEAVASASPPLSVGAAIGERYASPTYTSTFPTRVASSIETRTFPAQATSTISAAPTGYRRGSQTVISPADAKLEQGGLIFAEPPVELASAALPKFEPVVVRSLSADTPPTGGTVSIPDAEVIMGATEIVYSDAFITKEEFYASLANERDLYSTSLQKVLHAQVEKLKEAISLEVHKLNVRMDKLASPVENPVGAVENGMTKLQDLLSTEVHKLNSRMEIIGNPAEAMAKLQDLVSNEVRSMRQRIEEVNARFDETSLMKPTEFNAQTVNGLMDQMNHLNTSVDTCQVRLQKLEAYEETSAQNTLKLQTGVAQLQKETAQLQKETLIWQSNDEALQKQVDALRAAVDDTTPQRLLALEVYMEQTLAQELAELAQLASNPGRGDGFEREVHGLLEHLSKSSEAFDARLRKAEAGGGVKVDENLRIRVDNLYTSYEIMDTRLRGLEYNRNSTSDLSLEAIHSRLEQLCAKQEGECMTRCHQLMEAEARWSRQHMEIRTTMEKEKMDAEIVIGKAMGPIPVLVTIEGTSELPGMAGNVDACCVIEIVDKLRFQSVTKTSKLPIWDEGVQIDDFMLGDSIIFTVYDNHMNPQQDWPLPKGEIFGRAILHGSEVYLNGFEGRLQLFDTADDVNIFLKVRIGKLTGQVRAFRQEVESEEGKGELVQVLENYTDLVSEMRIERDERINTSMELRDEIMVLLQEEREDRARMCGALEAYFKHEFSTFRMER